MIAQSNLELGRRRILFHPRLPARNCHLPMQSNVATAVIAAMMALFRRYRAVAYQ